MTAHRTWLRLLALFTALALVAVACGDDDDTSSETTESTDATDPGDDEALADLIADAEEEGELQLLWVSVVTDELANDLMDGFNAFYDLDLSLSYTASGDAREIGGTVLQEQDAGLPASTDVYMGTSAGFLGLIEADGLEEYDYASLPDIPEEAVELDGLAVQMATRLSGITYNTDVIDEADVPESLDDVLALAEAGDYAVATTPFGSGFDVLAVSKGVDETVAFVEELSAAVAGTLACDVSRIVSEEFHMLAYDCGQSEAAGAIAEGAPIAFILPNDGGQISYFNLGIPTNAAHKAAAQLWINYMLTPEAQSMLYDAAYLDLHKLEGSQTAEAVDAAEEAGADLIESDLAFTIENADLLNEADDAIESALE